MLQSPVTCAITLCYGSPPVRFS